MKSIVIILLIFITNLNLWSQATNWNTFYSGKRINSVVTMGYEVWAGTNMGLVKIDSRSNHIKLYTDFKSIVSLREGKPLYIRDNGDLIFSFVNMASTYLNNDNNLSYLGNFYGANSVIEKENGVFWIATNYGIEREIFINENNTYIDSVITTKNSSLPNNMVTAMQFDSKDNLWIASYWYDHIKGHLGGVSKFNGSNWVIFDTLNSPLPTNQIKNLIIDSNDDVWIGTDGHGVWKYDNNNWDQLSQEKSSDYKLDFISTTSFSIDSSGNLWFGTVANGIYSFDGNNIRVFNTNNSILESNNINSISTDSSGKVWIATQCGLYYYENNMMTLIPTSNSDLPSLELKKLIKNKDKNVWFISKDYRLNVNEESLNGLVEYDGDKFTFISSKVISNSNQAVDDICSDLEGNIWAAYASGISKYDGKNWTIYPFNEGHFNDLLICSDPFGNIWLGNDLGSIIKFSNDDYIYYNSFSNDLPKKKISSIFSDGFYLWIAYADSSNSLLKVNIANSTNSIKYEYFETPIKYINKIYIDNIQNLWIASKNFGLAKFNGKEWSYYRTDSQSLPTNFVSSFSVNDFGHVAVACFDSTNLYISPGGVSIFNGKKWKQFTTSNTNFILDYINSVLIDNSDNIYALGNGGISIYNNKGGEISWYNQINIDYQLIQNFPNPFNSITTIKYIIQSTSDVHLIIYDILGKKISELVNERENIGIHYVIWNGEDYSGCKVSSGVYFYKLITNGKTITKKLVLIK